MDLSKLLYATAALLLIITGVLQLNRRFAEWSIRWFNSLKGIKTDITNRAITTQRVMGIIVIILGIALFVWGFIVVPSISNSIYSQN